MGRFAGGPRGDLVGTGRGDLHVAEDAIKKMINFDSALASYSNGEPEVLPIYADPDNIPRERAIGDEHAATPRGSRRRWCSVKRAATSRAKTVAE